MIATKPTYTIKFKGTIDRKYHASYIDPNHGRFTFFKNIVWKTNDFDLVKSFVSTYNTAAQRNRREAENVYMIVQIIPVDEKGVNAHWECEIYARN